MRALWLTREHTQTILMHARDAAPHEACGLLAGHNGRVLRVIPAANVATEPETRYEIDPVALAQHLPGFAAAGLDLIGFYHSHPQGKPIPSPTDIRESHYPDAAYLIVGLRGNDPKLAAWRIQAGRVDAIALHIGDNPPPESVDDTLSPAQRVAIVMTACVAFALMLAISLALLPPAPPIP